MARATHKMSGGVSRFNVVDHPYLLKAVPGNPYIGAVHDGVTTTYNGGFLSKHVPFLYRFRHNLLPVGLQGGFFSRNPSTKYVHWLEVSTIEKMRVRMVGEEASMPMYLSIAVIAFTCYHVYRYMSAHPDLTMYNTAVWTSKPWVKQTRFSKKHPLDAPVFRYIQRVPELYMQDSIRILHELDLSPNDNWVAFCKSIGKEKDLTATPTTRGFGEGSFGKLLPRNDVPYTDKHGHNPTFMR